MTWFICKQQRLRSVFVIMQSVSTYIVHCLDTIVFTAALCELSRGGCDGKPVYAICEQQGCR